MEEKWNRVLKETKIIRHRLPFLSSSDLTELNYIFLGASLVNPGDTVVREGKILVDKPMILLPKHFPQFQDFDLDEELGVNEDFFRSFLLIRGIRFPSLKYKHEVSTVDVFESDVDEAASHFGNLLERKEDIETGLVVGPTDAWQFSILLYINMLMQSSVERNINDLFDDFRRRLS